MIYVTGDAHENFRRFQPEYFPEQAGMTKDDAAIITVAFGGAIAATTKQTGSRAFCNMFRTERNITTGCSYTTMITA